MWIKREIESYFQVNAGPLRVFPVWLLLGPRQVGKSALLAHCGQSSRTYVNFDDLQSRIRATENPELFIKSLKPPICLDEIQYAPQILSGVKQLVDKSGEPGMVWMTGSQNFQVMKGVQETLAGRVAIMNLFGFTDIEKQITTQSLSDYYATLLNSDFPKLNLGPLDIATRSLYLSSYLQTYVERDVRELLGIQKRREFEVFLKVCALRTGQMINYEDMARDAQISPMTAKEWLSLLEDSFIVKIVHPWFTNRNKRLVKSPKLYFLDAGLACHLMGWQTREQIQYGPSAGAIFETHIFSNIYRILKHNLKTFDITFFRDKDGHEVDLFIEVGGRIYPVEIKTAMNVPAQSLVDLNKIKGLQFEGCGYVINPQMGGKPPLSLTHNWSAVSPEWFYEYILRVSASGRIVSP
jgi:predicted AAA+ superfamily ATPase